MYVYGVVMNGFLLLLAIVGLLGLYGLCIWLVAMWATEWAGRRPARKGWYHTWNR